MRVAMRILFVLAIPGVIFGFLLQVPPHYPDDPFAMTVDTTWIDLLPLLLAIPPIAFVGWVVYTVACWLTSGPRPSPRVRP